MQRLGKQRIAYKVGWGSILHTIGSVYMYSSISSAGAKKPHLLSIRRDRTGFLQTTTATKRFPSAPVNEKAQNVMWPITGT